MPDRFIFPCPDVVCIGIIYCLSAPISNGGALRKSKIGELPDYIHRANSKFNVCAGQR